ncbi:RNA-binding ribosome assembly factor RBP95 NDAI_0D01190 [Naumovozyma dairenensis CBS 421]|uniref:WKF domain-containing protein n=1 Tax=Naumovozyma dairenensis (strain ATCC 10597 / BCRC 20456 / CBS 421 / NBRC 0211 / NRRL Y-12639) TaxID=1071378 RepID=G0W9H1_NAUDC|nr:hypothetical protein NDAI_0D01190 [Naumovozyma dairenensis CBS 421]CCD24432.1 hypothetical protein NDAI_0D01190 [Naumovozyma dairenensis CBS 421]
MSSNHIPAWRKIAIKKKLENKDGAVLNDDPLNVTTHLATGSLTRKEKKRIIKGESSVSVDRNKVSKLKKSGKREKLPKDQRITKKSKVLKDQLRYLIEFYKSRVENTLPKELYALENVKLNFPGNDEDDKIDPASGVIEIWKFSKQKQNWLIKHFFNMEEIPSEYDPLLISYFKDLPGKSKDDLSEKCLGQIKSWNEYVEKEEAKMSAIVNGDENKEGTNDEGNDDEASKEDEIKEKKPEDISKIEIEVVPNKEATIRSHLLLKQWFINEEDLTKIILKNLPI